MNKAIEAQLLQEIRSISERLARIEESLSAIRHELSQKKSMSAAEYDEIDRRLAAVAEKFVDEYAPGTELTIFTTDGADEFYEEE